MTEQKITSLRPYSILKGAVLLVVLDLIMTASIIYWHTPTPPSLIFDFSCLNTQQTCPVEIDEDRSVAFKKSIENAVKISRRLGTLSDVYTSLMRFRVDVLNLSVGYVTIASTTPQKVTGDVQCVDTVLAYGAKKEVENYFVLSDSAGDLVTSVASYVNSCPGFLISAESLTHLPELPPGSIVTFKVSPEFIPTFSPDLLSWVLVFVFNLLVLTGLLPFIREGWRFLRKGHEYFSIS